MFINKIYCYHLIFSLSTIYSSITSDVFKCMYLNIYFLNEESEQRKLNIIILIRINNSGYFYVCYFSIILINKIEKVLENYAD